MEWSIQEVARLVGTTSRTLRHYDDIGLLRPSGIGNNGYRRYDETTLVRLQRILLLRELGLGLPQIGEVLERSVAPADALAVHLDWLRQEQDRLTRQIASVESTITTLKGGESLMAENMFDGFDHTRYKEEVEQRWGKDAYARGDAWWRSMSATDKAAWQARVNDLQRDWAALAAAHADPAGVEAQDVAARHVAWLRGIPGTPSAPPATHIKQYVIGLGEMYVADPRFSANYGGTTGAEFVRDTLRVYADAHL
jgi:DNA-binding transcriptional MerR regulator